MNETLHSARNRLDVITAVLGVCGGLASLYLYILKSANVYLLMIGVIFTFTCSIYLLFRKKLLYPVELNIPHDRIHILVLNIIFVLLFTGSIYALHTNTFRPPIYFVLISLCCSVLAVEVLLYTPAKKYMLYLLLFEICLVAFNLRAGIYFNYRGMIGVDPWELRLFVEGLINTGAVVESGFSGKYSIFVFMQIYSAIATLICGVSSKTGMFIAVTLPIIFCCIFIFLTARVFLNEKIGLMAMLIYVLCDFSISDSLQICAWSFGIALYIVILYLLVADKKSLTKYQFYFLFLFFAVLILTHPVPTAILAIPLIILFVFTKLSKSPKVVIPSLVLLYIVGTLSYWTFVSFTSGRGVKRTFFQTIAGPLYHSLTKKAAVLHRVEVIEKTAGSASASASADYLFFESFLNNMGFSLVVLFGLIGVLVLLYAKKRDFLTLSLIAMTIVVFAIPFGFGFLGIRNITNYRWFVYGYVTLAILAAVGLLTLIGQIRSTNRKVIITFSLIFVLALFMTTATWCNHDGTLYLKDSTVRLAITEQELSFRNELIDTYNGPIWIDGTYNRAIIYGEPFRDPKDITYFHAGYSYKDFCDGNLPQSMVIWREYNKDRPIYMRSPKGRMLVVLGQNFHKNLKSEAYNKIYCNGGTTAYSYIT